MNITVRNNARALLLNEDDELLLMRIDDPNIRDVDGYYRGPLWCTAGGGVELNESLEDAVLRELFEETGITKDKIQLGKLVWIEEHNLIYKGLHTCMKNHFFISRTLEKIISMDNLTKNERNVVNEMRWFSLESIKEWHETIYPKFLYKYLKDILSGKMPSSPIYVE